MWTNPTNSITNPPKIDELKVSALSEMVITSRLEMIDATSSSKSYIHPSARPDRYFGEPFVPAYSLDRITRPATFASKTVEKKKGVNDET